MPHIPVLEGGFGEKFARFYGIAKSFYVGRTFKEIKTLCPDSEVADGMNIVFESYSDKLVTKEQEEV